MNIEMEVIEFQVRAGSTIGTARGPQFGVPGQAHVKWKASVLVPWGTEETATLDTREAAERWLRTVVVAIEEGRRQRADILHQAQERLHAALVRADPATIRKQD